MSSPSAPGPTRPTPSSPENMKISIGI